MHISAGMLELQRMRKWDVFWDTVYTVKCMRFWLGSARTCCGSSQRSPGLLAAVREGTWREGKA